MKTIDIDQIKVLNQGHGLHFFSKSTMNLFNSKTHGDAQQNEGSEYSYFITSEQYEDSRGNQEPRRYTIRRCNLITGICITESAFQEFDDLNEAQEELDALMIEKLKEKP